jgi:hypothetical protein
MPNPTFEAALAEMHRLLCVAQGPPPEDERAVEAVRSFLHQGLWRCVFHVVDSLAGAGG